MPHTLPFRILDSNGEHAAYTAAHAYTHVVLTEHDADDNPRCSPGAHFVTRHECSFNVMDLTPACEHGWRYDDYSRAMARDDAQGMIDAIIVELGTNTDREQLAALRSK